MKMRTMAPLACGAVLRVSGCDGADPPPPTSSTTTSSSSSGTTPATTATTPVTTSSSPSVSIPTAARAHTQSGAAAFGEFVLLQADQAYVSTDVSTFRSLVSPLCSVCTGIITDVEDLSRLGQHQVGLASTIGLHRVAEGSTADLVIVEYLVDGKKTGIVDATGANVDYVEAAKSTIRVTARWMGGRWQGQNIQTVVQ